MQAGMTRPPGDGSTVLDSDAALYGREARWAPVRQRRGACVCPANRLGSTVR